ncbi:MAG: ribonuclease P protein component [Lachnospiraceae bacterium]|uniref:Ribonuclease P protein component n=1 Tax=Candidatus Weimeria bifida TaxID=2599074 RepID=A0A6N7J068_9FIRM|nr:ribonuclease P protein component [Candidatus Weimeria bifida]RRF96926.1 MAG: ribonuclease P protein component [Lachnospiraceae bacterium]
MKFTDSLKKNSDFKKVYRRGRSKSDHTLVLYVLPNDMDSNRLGISVSKKVGNSVVRHHLTRLVRESYRIHEDLFPKGYDFVVILRKAAKDADFHLIECSLLTLFKYHGLI